MVKYFYFGTQYEKSCISESPRLSEGVARDVVVLDQSVPQGARQVVECGSAIGELCVAACAAEGSSCARSSE